MYDPELYRTKDEVERWKQRDPIPTFAALLRDQGWLSETALAAMEQAVAAEVESAVRVAEEGPWESVADLTKDVYAPGPAPAGVAGSGPDAAVRSGRPQQKLRVEAGT
jgi:TPP-dependent pyruvate/acetoin dehydrogenase alpha subunit